MLPASLTPWLISAAPITIILLDIWKSPQPMIPLMHSAVRLMMTQNNTTTGKNLVGFPSILIPTFIMIILLNLSGLMPFLLSTTSHLLLNLSVAFVLWLSLILSSLSNCLYTFIVYLLPTGAPGTLNPFLTLAEVLSTSVRPITLSVRLTANMGAGHTVMTLLCSYMTTAMFSKSPLLLLLTLIVSFYFVFEFAICLIQASILSMLLTMYSSEHSRPLNKDSFLQFRTATLTKIKALVKAVYLNASLKNLPVTPLPQYTRPQTL
uniref:ATP synthase subunit a n=1 Tax=Brachiopoda sp. TaxID=3230945 RepID=A0AAU8HNU2_9BILA